MDHITAGAAAGAISWLCNPAAKASANYLVTKKGEIYQLVKDENTAWHAGIVNKPNWALYDGTNPNRYTIGIEHEALAGEALTETQYQATLWLHRHLVQTYSIPVDNDHIIGHYRIDNINRKNDPGPGFPWERLFNDLWLGTVSVPIKMGTSSMLGVIIHNVSYAPVRTLAEGLGYKVTWDNTLNAALIPPVNIKVPIGPAGTVQIATGSSIIPGYLIGGKAYAPVRQLAEALGHKVSWDNVNRIVIVE